MNFEQELQRRVQETETVIRQYLPCEDGFQDRVAQAMRYAVDSGGKRLRPLLMKEVYVLYGGSSPVVEPFMAALEMIHSYSLVHDDLPCMDNDEFRRGRKSTWAAYGEAVAVLAGDGLLNLAFETACRAFDLLPSFMEASLEDSLLLAARHRALSRALALLAAKAGIQGMIGGQAADMEAENLSPGEAGQELLMYIHEKKTAALIQSAMMIGAVLAGADEAEVRRMEAIAGSIGVAFQIRDDMLDLIGSQEKLGKPVGSDERNSKATYVTVNGLEEAAAKVESLSRDALEGLETFGEKGEFLRTLVRKLITREK